MNPDATICLLCKRSAPSPHGVTDDGLPCPNRGIPWPRRQPTPAPDKVAEAAEKVTHLGQQRHDLASLVADIKAAVYARSGQISTIEAIGALELAKHEIIGEQQ